MNLIHAYNESCHRTPSAKTHLLRQLTSNAKKKLMDWCVKLVNTNIGETLNVLDLACGKGGDLHKWTVVQEESIPNKLIFWQGVDFSPDSVDEANKRLLTTCGFAVNSNAVTFNVLDNCFASDGNTLQWNDHCLNLNADFFDICSIQMALHYFCQSEQDLQSILRNVSLSLKPNGIFVTTFMDCCDLFHSRNTVFNWPAIGISLHRHENNAYNVFIENSLPNCKEYLTNVRQIITVAREFGLVVIRNEKLNYFASVHNETGQEYLETMDFWSHFRSLVFVKKTN